MSERALKFSVAADDLPKARAALLAMAGRPRPSRSTLWTTYYDTDDDALRRRELMLRVRKRGRQFFQTVQAHDLVDGDVLERGEWEDPIKTAQPDLAAPRSGAQLGAGIEAADLRPLFCTAIERARFVLVPLQGTEITVAILRGEIRVEDGRSEPIHELALELKRGDSAVLWDVALRLLEIVPCRIEMRSDAERGYRLARGAALAPPVLHDHALALRPDMTLDAALQAADAASLPCSCATRLPRSRSCPKAFTRCVSPYAACAPCCSAVRQMLPEEHHRWAQGELKWLGSALGPARNWDVFADCLLAPVSAALPGRAGIELSRCRGPGSAP